MTTTTMVDFYELLGVDASADRAVIESALNRRQPEWSALTRSASDGSRYLEYLEQIPALRHALLSTPEARALYDEQLSASRRNQKSKSLDQLQRLVRLRAAKGGLTVSDRQHLRAEADRLGLSAAEIDRMAESFPPLPEPPAEPEISHLAETIDPASARQIAAVLEALDRRDLYHVLDLPRDAPESEIVHRAGELRRLGSRRGPVSEESTLWLHAVGLVQAHLTNPKARARYDASLERAAMHQFSHLAEKVVAGHATLDPAMHEALRLEASAHGLTLELGERCIRKACKTLGVALGAPATPAADLDARKRWLRCRQCFGLTEFGWAEIHSSGQCRHCHASLRWECLVCKNTLWTDEPQCRCGFALEHHEAVVRHFETAQRAFRLHQLGEAMAELRRVLALAPSHAGARIGLQKVHQQIQSIRKLRADFDRERAARRLVSARAILDRWERLVSPSDTRWKSGLADVSSRLSEAEALTAKARNLAESDATSARAYYRRALAIACDLPDANDGLSRCPPDGPTELFAEPRSGRVHLRWTPPEPDGQGPVRFRILRKRSAAPTHTEDGAVVAEIAEPEWEDAHVLAGDSWGYAVCSVREGITSLYGVSSGPFVVTAEVRNARADCSPGRVRLSWTSPAGAIGARVVRKLGGPVENPRDGLGIEAGNEVAIDEGLQDGRLTHYAIYALFRAHDGRTVASRGVALAAMPGAMPGPVDDLRVEPELDGRLWLRWDRTTADHVRLASTTESLPWLRGERVAPADIERLACAWIEPAAPGEAYDAMSDMPTLRYYTPISFGAGVATIGRHASWIMLSDPRRVRACRGERDPNTVTVRWEWAPTPRNLTTRLVARTGRYPAGPDDPDAIKLNVDAESYWRDGGCRLALPETAEAPWHIVVYSCLNEAGESWYSPGIEPSARCVVPPSHACLTVYYTVQPPHAASSTWNVRLATDPHGGEIGPTVLVARPRVLPLSPQDGAVIARFPACTDGTTMQFRPSVRLNGRKLRLFADPSAAPIAQAMRLIPKSPR